MKIKLNDKTGVDFDSLIASRLLIQANSGGGKSWAIRRIIEQGFGGKQIIVIDPEGEFVNLREKFDFVYAGKGGDVPVESRSAHLLATRLLELKASAIIDLYELPPQERKHFVKLFFDAMINAPKELWHDCLIILDEAHIFAPEKDQSESLSSVIDMASRGRKRGFALVPATQRPAKLNKDVAAECNNKLIGRASLDIDRKRSAEELGFTSKEEVLSLRNLEPGEFYAFGPAISRDVIKVTIGDVVVKPAKRVVHKSSPPPPSDKIKKILSELSDLPQEAAREIETTKSLKEENTKLKREMQTLKQQPQQVVPPIQMIEKAIKFALAKRADQELVWEKRMITENDRLRTVLTKLSGRLNTSFSEIAEMLQKAIDIEAPMLKEREAGDLLSYIDPKILNNTPEHRPIPIPGRDSSHHQPTRVPLPQSASTEGITGPEQRILDAIALSESIGIEEPEQTAVAFLAGYTYGGGGFNNPRGALKTKALVEYRGSKIALTDWGRSMANIPTVPLTRETMREKVMSILPGPEQKLLGPLMDRYPDAMSNEDLALASGYTNGSGGFNNPKGRLRTLGLIEYPSSGHSRARGLLFP